MLPLWFIVALVKVFRRRHIEDYLCPPYLDWFLIYGLMMNINDLDEAKGERYF